MFLGRVHLVRQTGGRISPITLPRIGEESHHQQSFPTGLIVRLVNLSRALRGEPL